MPTQNSQGHLTRVTCKKYPHCCRVDAGDCCVRADSCSRRQRGVCFLWQIGRNWAYSKISNFGRESRSVEIALWISHRAPFTYLRGIRARRPKRARCLWAQGVHTIRLFASPTLRKGEGNSAFGPDAHRGYLKPCPRRVSEVRADVPWGPQRLRLNPRGIQFYPGLASRRVPTPPSRTRL